MPDVPARPEGASSHTVAGRALAVRTRFTPSPNGPLHVGHARTGAFNWILARQRAGEYFVRFERTDRLREAPGARVSMVEDLEWLGLLGDEEPHDQVELADHHRAALDRLVEGGYAYADGGAVRFKVPAEGFVEWDDLVRGTVVVANKDLDDPVLVRSSGVPTFFLASTADDIHDQVSHLIRPDVLLRATAKQLHIWAALGHPAPSRPPCAHEATGRTEPHRRRWRRFRSTVARGRYPPEGVAGLSGHAPGGQLEGGARAAGRRHRAVRSEACVSAADGLRRASPRCAQSALPKGRTSASLKAQGHPSASCALRAVRARPLVGRWPDYGALGIAGPPLTRSRTRAAGSRWAAGRQTID